MDFFEKVAKYKSTYEYPVDLAKYVEPPEKPANYGHKVRDMLMGVTVGGVLGNAASQPLANIAKRSKIPYAGAAVQAAGTAIGAGLLGKFEHSYHKLFDHDYAEYDKDPEAYKKLRTEDFNKNELPYLRRYEENYTNAITRHPYAPKGLTTEIAAKRYRESSGREREIMSNDSLLMMAAEEEGPDWLESYKEPKIYGFDDMYKTKTASNSDYDFPVERETYSQASPALPAAIKAGFGGVLGGVVGMMAGSAPKGALIGAGLAASTSIPSALKYTFKHDKYVVDRDSNFRNNVVKGWQRNEDTYANELMRTVREEATPSKQEHFKQLYKDLPTNDKRNVLERKYTAARGLYDKIGEEEYEKLVRNNFRTATTKAKNREMVDFVAGGPPTNIVMPGAEKVAGIANFGRKVISNLKGRKEDLAHISKAVDSNLARANFGLEGMRTNNSNMTFLKKQFDLANRPTNTAREAVKKTRYLDDQVSMMKDKMNRTERYQAVAEKALGKSKKLTAEYDSIKRDVRNTRLAAGGIGVGLAGAGAYAATRNEKTASSAEDEYVQFIMKHPNIPKGYTAEKARADYKKASSDQRYHLENMAYEAYETDGKSPSSLQFPKFAAFVGYDSIKRDARNEKTAGMWSNYVSNLKGRKDDRERAEFILSSLQDKVDKKFQPFNAQAQATASMISMAQFQEDVAKAAYDKGNKDAFQYFGQMSLESRAKADRMKDEAYAIYPKAEWEPDAQSLEAADTRLKGIKRSVLKTRLATGVALPALAYGAYRLAKHAALADEAVKAVTKSPIAKGAKDAVLNTAAQIGFSGYGANRRQNERPGNIQLAGDN